MIFVYYFKTTGQISKIVEASSTVIADLNSNEIENYVIDSSATAKESTHIVNLTTMSIVSKTTQSITPTPSSIAADGSTKSTITGIATGSTFWSDQEPKVSRKTVQGSKAYFCTNIVATHTLTFKHPLYLDTEVEITATTP